MCGILGIITRNKLGGLRDPLRKANDIVSHRGPDGEGFALFNLNGSETFCAYEQSPLPSNDEIGRYSLGLGHRRLSIIDLSSAGLQPMCDNEKKIWISYNGEVYNYIELRQELIKLGHEFKSGTDTEVIIYAYKEWGENCVKRFNGMWSFGIVDLRRNKIFCSRDRLGVKPFHYHFDGTNFVFSSEIKQILQFPFVSRKPREQAVFEYLRYGNEEFGSDTFFDGINKLEQGNNLIFDIPTFSLKTERYFDRDFSINHQISFDEAAEEFKRLLKDSVKLRLRSDVPVGSCLSGGLDSSSIVCIMNQYLDEGGNTSIQHTFSSHFDDKEANEYEYMREVIENTNVNPHFIYPTGEQLVNDIEDLVWHQEEPFSCSSHFSEWSVYKLVHENNIKVMLDGQGPDEMMAGYIGFVNTFLQELYQKQKVMKTYREALTHGELYDRNALSLLPGDLIKRNNRHQLPNLNAPSHPPIDWIASDLYDKYKDINSYKNYFFKNYPDLELLNNYLYQSTFLYNLQMNLRSGDRSAMAFSVESRGPFLDYRLSEFLFSLPSEFKIRGGYTKALMRKAMKDILPEKIRLRTKKLGYTTPEKRWQQTDLRPLIDKALNDFRLKSLIKTDKASDYLEKLEKHDLLDYAPWRWINLNLWLKVFELN